MALASIALLSLFATPIPSPQVPDFASRTINKLEFQNADAREALAYIGKAVNAHMVVGPEVQGAVSLSLTNVTFDVAVGAITRQIGATYLYRDNKVVISGSHQGMGAAGAMLTPDQVAEMERVTEFMKSKRVARYQYRGNDLGEAIGTFLRASKVPHLVLVDFRMPIEADLQDVDLYTLLSQFAPKHYLNVRFLPGAKTPTLIIESNRNLKSSPLTSGGF